MDNEIVLATGDNEPEDKKRNTGIRYDKRGENYGLLTQDIYTTRELSDTLGVHHTTILEQIKLKRLKALYLGGPAGYRIHKAEVINWVRGLSASDPESE
jgi:excisionase family DNA binding protein